MKHVTYFTKALLIYSAVGAAIVIAFVAPYIWTFHGGLSTDYLAWGSFGSYFGSILGPLFSGFAFVLLLYNVHLQRKETESNKRKSRVEALTDTLKIIADRIQKSSLDFVRGNNLGSLTEDEIATSVGEEFIASLKYMFSCMSEIDDLVPNSPITGYYKSLFRDVYVKLGGILRIEATGPFWHAPTAEVGGGESRAPHP